MKVKAILKAFGDKKQGTSEATGNSWESMRVILEWDEDENGQVVTNRVAANAFGDLVRLLASNAFSIGDAVVADLLFKTASRNGGQYVNNYVDLKGITLC